MQTKHWKIRAAVLCLCVGVGSACLGKVIYVDANAPGAGNGTNWADAYNYLQDALAAASAGDEIRVAQGTYKPDKGGGITPGDRAASFHLTNGTIVKGGYAGSGEPNPNARDFVAYETILSGDIGAVADFSDNSYHIVQGGDNAILEGFTVVGGNANGSFQGGYGIGGGLYNDNCRLVVANCTFEENAALNGGAIFSSGGTLAVHESIFVANFALQGGALVNLNGHTTLTGCVLRNNADGTIFCFGNGALQVESCVLDNNYGGWHAIDRSGTGSVIEVINSLFTRNAGGAISSAYNSLLIVNSTLVDNHTTTFGGAVCCSYGSLTAVNCIMWGNTAGWGGDEIFGADAATAVSYSCIARGYPGTGNINADPLFVNPGSHWPTEGLVSHWKFDEGTGTTAHDSAGDNPGTVHGDAEWTTGQVAGALSFDGWDDYVTVEHDDDLNITGDITISAWVSFTQGASYQAIVTKCVSNGRRNNPFDFRTTDFEPVLTLVRADATAHERVYSTVAMPLRQWHHVLVRVEDNVPDFYVNGAITRKYADTTFTRIPTGNTNPLLIGARDDGLYFNGLIDDVMIFNRALSPEEIHELYLNGLSGAYGQNGDYHLLDASPCIDAGTDAGVYRDMEGNIRPLDFPRVDNNGDLPEFDMGAYEIVPRIEAPMKFTPQVVNCRGKGKWVKAHFTLPAEFTVGDVDANRLAKVEPLGIESEYMSVFVNDDGVVEIEAAFDRAAFCGAVKSCGPIEITVTGSLTSGEYFYGKDTIKIIKNSFECLAFLSSHWLELNCSKPDCCDGFDADRDTTVNLKDFAVMALRWMESQ